MPFKKLCKNVAQNAGRATSALWRLLKSPSPPAILAALFIIGTTWFAFRTKDNVERREHIANVLATYYSAASAEYYAAKELTEAEEEGRNSAYYISIFALEDSHFTEFQSASTRLAAEVPPSLREEVLSVEGLWEEIRDLDYTSSTVENVWFSKLEEVRRKVLDEIAYTPSLDPGWRR